MVILAASIASTQSQCVHISVIPLYDRTISCFSESVDCDDTGTR